LDVFAEGLFITAGDREGELVRAFLHYGRLADVHARFVSDGREFNGLAVAVRAEQLCADAGSGERFVLRVGQAGPHDDSFTKLITIAFDK
jgi:hypothetical protein